ncbi:glycoside hydrolase family 2 TIM barrel-domain containing protein [Reichenbachiella versicolor]|uniref:glycoside hydrolase family 2 TIM barrel-domain containing protein n=1 Tax=Reichenbachiella versicolor TaxID=1821036 RepID=UPI000D6DCB80|nr:glycoside hydrolase family 2 TIM barrel-domain containing protein [Reichenbachiella versicolor]
MIDTTKKTLLTILVLLCTITYSASAEDTGESVFSLNGTWKFKAFAGEGSNYRDIVPTETDIIIDNDDDRVKTEGNWQTSTEPERETLMWGKDYKKHFFKPGDKSNLKYFPSLKKAGYYEVYAFHPFGANQNIQYNIKHKNGVSTDYLSGRTQCGVWASLGVHEFTGSDQEYVEITSVAKSVVVADGIMFRPLDSKKFEESKVQSSKAHEVNVNASDWLDLKVPGHWGMINEYSNYSGIAWYRKHVKLPSDWKKNDFERVRLKFGAVYHLANIFVNGQKVGSHRGGLTPFEFDVTDFLNFDGDNIIAVQVDNNFIVGATWNWGGIIRDVELVKNNDVRISYQYIHADPNLTTGTADINLKVRVENKSGKTRKLSFKSSISKDSELAQMEKSIKVAANSTFEFETTTSLTKEQVKLWHFDTPELYQISSSITEKGKVVHVQSDRFGIRKVEVSDSQFFLNGEAVRLAGFNRVSDHRYWGSSEPQEIINLDVDQMKESGANFMRIMHGTQNEKLIDRCDEKGILLFEEVNVRHLSNPEFTAPGYPLVRQWLREMIERDVNHASIIGWSVGNELADHYEYGRDIIKYLKDSLDDKRLVTCVSNSGWRKTQTPENDPNTFVDIIMHNHYGFQGPANTVFQELRSKWNDKPIFISEYGVGRHPTTSLDEDLKNVSVWNKEIRFKNTFIVGASLWTYNDYKSGYAGSTEEENRTWGLVDVWRQKRRFFDRISKENSPVNGITISEFDAASGKGTVTIDIKGPTDYPCYTMRDYSLDYEFKDRSGKTVKSFTKELPTLSPMDELWSGEISWDAPKDAFSFHINLMSPNGYSRYEEVIHFDTPSKPIITNVIESEQGARIYFTPTFDASEYFVTYTDKANNKSESIKTINPYLDLDSLSNNAYSVQLFAMNPAGISEGSTEHVLSPKGTILPPFVWKTMIRDSKLIIGITGEIGDMTYEVKYGNSKNNLNKTVKTNARGMIVADLDFTGDVYFKIKRTNKDKVSSWSPVQKATKG